MDGHTLPLRAVVGVALAGRLRLSLLALASGGESELLAGGGAGARAPRAHPVQCAPPDWPCGRVERGHAHALDARGKGLAIEAGN
jgi:hypothetical protein